MPPSKLIIAPGSDFTAPTSPKSQAKITLCGESKVGKTTFALRYAPDPVALLNFDGRAAYAAQEATLAGRRILTTEIRVPGDINRMGEDAVKKAGQLAIDKTMKNLEWAVRESQKGNVRTICFDTGTEYGNFLTLAFRGKLGLIKDYGKSKDLINQQLLRLYQVAADGNAHLIMLTRAKATWAGEEPSGKFEPRAYEVLSEAADIVAHLRFRRAGKGKVGRDSEIEILSAGTDRSQLGAVYRESDWEDLGGPFVYTCLMNYPGTVPEDWQ